jgi:predicted RNA-binding protein with TRAM domain
MASVVATMPEISDSLRLLFETTVEQEEGRYVVSIPSDLVENGTVSPDTLYRVALLGPGTGAESTSGAPTADEPVQASRAEPKTTQGPPVEEGETRMVSIDTLGDQGDGIAKVERGFIVIVPGTKPGDRVEVEITDVKDTVAFAETVGEATVR